MRLDRLLGHLGAIGRPQVRARLQAGEVYVDGHCQRDGTLPVDEFQEVVLAGQVLQAGRAARYLLLHKPLGYVSDRLHERHPSALQLIDAQQRDDLHLAGRLDLNTSGALLLTNDGRWSRRVTQPQNRHPKVYRVRLEDPIDARYVERFAEGMYFAYEDLTTLPAQLELLDSHNARLTLHEGRYHQVKRMFGQFRNKVVALHRESVGPITLGDLPCGTYRTLSAEEIAAF